MKDTEKRVDDEAPEAVAEEAGAVNDDAAAEVEADEPVAEQDTEQDTEQDAGDEAVSERADESAEEPAAEAAEEIEDAIAADLDKARTEAALYLDDLRRLQADFDNYRKRTLREQTARSASASQALVARLLPVLDNFELAVSAAE